MGGDVVKEDVIRGGCIEGGCSYRVTSKEGYVRAGVVREEGCDEGDVFRWDCGEGVVVSESSRKVEVFTVEFCCNDCAKSIYLGFSVIIIIIYF